MRVLLWNCNNGINKQSQISYFQSFKPDLAVVPELKEANVKSLAPSSYVWLTNNHSNSKPKGLGILAFNGIAVTQLPTDKDMEIFIPINVRGNNFSFKLLAVWNFYWACKQGRFKDVKEDGALEYAALKHYLPILNSPSLIVGDWNLGPTFAQEAFLKICGMVGKFGLKSLYHQFYQLAEEETQHSTFKSTRNTYHHLDQVFGCQFFQKKLSAFHIPCFDEVVLSDHAPIFMEFDFFQIDGNQIR